MTTGTHRSVGPGLQGVEGAFEAEAFAGHVVGAGDFQEQRADEIIGNGVHPQFAFDHAGGAAAQDVGIRIVLLNCSPSW